MTSAESNTNKPQQRIIFLGLLLVLIALSIGGFWLFQQSKTSSVNEQLQTAIAQHNITPIDLGPLPDPAKVRLGQQLFFDKEISGTRDTSCATCHHPDFAGADGRPLPIGTGGKGLGPSRLMGKSRELVPRNAPELFNRGSAEWDTMFWDGRVAANIYAEGDGAFISPASDLLPAGLDSALAVQAMFPPTSAVEMRGMADSVDVHGTRNEVSADGDPTLPEVWDALTQRLLAIDAYQALFAEAYPNTAADDLGFQHAANALAAFEIDAFSFNDSPWDQYMLGNESALTAEQKEGALLFFGEANCASCHSGSLMTDQQYHNIAVPQMGPGKNNEDGFDFGRYLETEIEADRFAFRTPPLANIALTGPYMHNGAYDTLESAVRHHLNSAEALANYDLFQLDPSLRDTAKRDQKSHDYILATLDQEMATPITLSDEEFGQLMQFLHALTSPSATDLSHLVPQSVPSGLPIVD